MLGPGIISAFVPVNVGYAIHSLRKAADRRWALAALIVASLLALPVLWFLFVVIKDVLVGDFFA